MDPPPSKTCSLILLLSTSSPDLSADSSAWCTTSLAGSNRPMVPYPGRIPIQFAVTIKMKMVAISGKNRRPRSLPATLSVSFRNVSRKISNRLWSLPGTSFTRRVPKKETRARKRMAAQVATIELVIWKLPKMGLAVTGSAASCTCAMGTPKKPPPNACPRAPPAIPTTVKTPKTITTVRALGLARSRATISSSGLLTRMFQTSQQ